VSVPLERCPRCRRTPRLVDRGRAIGAYDGALRAIIHALKYEGRRSLARPLGALMRPARRGHARRRRLRDPRTAPCVAPPATAASTRPPISRGTSGSRRWRRCGASARTPTQTGLPAAQRHRNVRDAFALTRAGAGLAGAAVVLIDDVEHHRGDARSCAHAR
jgi:predicted amidophosphoribosyltransferase